MSIFKFYIYRFEKLDVWQIARRIKKTVYLMTNQFPKNEKYGLANQLRRSINSVSANLAEGSGRASGRDKAHFTNMAYSSALETINHLVTAYDLSYIDDKTYEKIRVRMDELINKLNGYYKYQLKNNNHLNKNFE